MLQYQPVFLHYQFTNIRISEVGKTENCPILLMSEYMQPLVIYLLVEYSKKDQRNLSSVVPILLIPKVGELSEF